MTRVIIGFISLALLAIASEPPRAQALIALMTSDEYLTSFKQSIADRDSENFAPITHPEIIIRFELVIDALLDNDLSAADSAMERLNHLGVYYCLVDISDVSEPTFGFLELARPGDNRYKGWGSILVHPYTEGYVVYQAPHVKFELFTEEITLQAFHTNPNAAAVVLAGAHRYANADHDRDGSPDADVAHETENLFYIATKLMAHKGWVAHQPYWFVQFHGAYDRFSEPSIVASTGALRPKLEETTALVRIDEAIDALGLITMGVCGWREGFSDQEDGIYYLTAIDNIQGRMLEARGLRYSFMHFEIERTLRDAYYYGVGPTQMGVLQFLDALKLILGDRCATPAGRAEEK